MLLSFQVWNHPLTEAFFAVPACYCSYHRLSSSPKKAPKDNILLLPQAKKDNCSLMFIKGFVLSKHGTNKSEASVHPCEVGILLPMLRDGETEAQSD